MDTLTYSGRLVVVTCWCGVRHAVPSELRAEQQRQRDARERITDCYCPLGHVHVPAGEGRAAKLERELEYERNRSARLAAQADQARASARAHKGVATKAKKRGAAGVCPVEGCGRSFKQLRRHMQSQHPGYDPEG